MINQKFVLKMSFKSLINQYEKKFFSTINNKTINFINKNGNKKNEKGKLFSIEKFENFNLLNVKNLNNRELLYYIGYCSKHKLLNLNILDTIMKEVEINIINSINCITTDLTQNKKNILNSKSYNSQNSKPFFDIHDLIKVYLNICYINSYFFLKTKYYGKLNNGNLLNEKKDINEVKKVFENNILNNKKYEEKKDNLNYKNNDINELFNKDEFIYTNTSNKKYEPNEFICNEYIKNIFNLLSIFFLQNINMVNDHYLCRLFYGYNKSKFYNERYLNNLCFEIIKRVKKIRAYHLHLILVNCYYLNYIDTIFVKVLLINLISKFSQLPCEAMCKIIPIIPLYINSEKLIYKVNVIYSKKIASFNQINHIINLFKKMIQYNFISQKNVFLTFKHLNKFINIKKNNLKTNILKKREITEENMEQNNLLENVGTKDNIINNIVENFEEFEYQDKKKNIMINCRNEDLPLEDNILYKNENKNFDNNGNIDITNIKNSKDENISVIKKKIYKKDESYKIEEPTYINKDDISKKDEIILKKEEDIFKKEDILFNLKVIEMHLKHDLKSIYCLLPNEYKNFLQKVRNTSCIINKNLQGEKEIYILKKYMKLLNYKFITFTYGPYILHICDPFYKIYVEWENVWKLYPIYEQNSQKNFEINKNKHMKKEGFDVIYVSHDSFLNYQNENEKMEYLNSILKDTKFSRCNTFVNEKNSAVPLEEKHIYM
ncbi:conserved Plasmodium protein, unknown function [Plasmodium gallinaceum]|uniref:RAP domain-containing protein n=1 Tax=Plasmodium gallinaceum TaxID=5849 RepID=A0A1J1GZ02_PLAGA|nr:conserved Plasmodium protein, unknown function [Plasmodium gallinaceum]CRG97693.1 conserved Plasmodium protein, unknown function [Plasmodium gallinaceum]